MQRWRFEYNKSNAIYTLQSYFTFQQLKQFLFLLLEKEIDVDVNGENSDNALMVFCSHCTATAYCLCWTAHINFMKVSPLLL